jgi:protein-disulfide isomerase
MKHFIAGAAASRCARASLSIAAFTLFALGAGCEKAPDQDTSPGAGAAIQKEAPQAEKVNEAAQPAPPAGCGEPREDCGCDGEAVPSGASASIEDVHIGSSPARGPENAPVTIVIFSDFQCPFCAKAERTIADLEAAYPGKLRFVFKNHPLPFHASAKLAAKAALAAGEQGKFWAYHDTLFVNQGRGGALDQALLEDYAGDLGLDLARFRRSMGSEALDAAIEADIAEVKRLTIRGTPTYFVNGRRIIGAQPLPVFRATVDPILAAL